MCRTPAVESGGAAMILLFTGDGDFWERRMSERRRRAETNA
jgi:hypothetical protein